MKSLLSQMQKKKYILTSVIAMLLGTSLLQGQTANNVDIGLGGGLSYGGLGAQLNYRPIEKLGVFGGLGYNLDALGYNLGIKFHLPSEKRLSAYLTGMYGYNTVLLVEAVTMDAKTTYFGFSTGIGAEFKLKASSFLCAEILVPFRSQAYNNAVDDLESIGYDIQNPLPLAFCIGYHIKF